jgi:hypothetical protein
MESSNRWCISQERGWGGGGLGPASLRDQLLWEVAIKIKKIYMVLTLHLCVLGESKNKQRLLPWKTLTDCFLEPRWRVFTARYALSPYIKQIRFVFKGLNSQLVINDTIWCNMNTLQSNISNIKSNSGLKTYRFCFRNFRIFYWYIYIYIYIYICIYALY